MGRFQRGLVLVCFLGVIGCGSGNTSDPVDDGSGSYPLYRRQTETIPAGTGLTAGPFTLPVDGMVAYTITNWSTTTRDRWDISIIPASELPFFAGGQPYRGYAPHANVSTQSDSSDVPAGTYTIGILCRNVSEDCQFTLDATMFY